MGRKLRVDFPGAWHHVMNRGGRHQPIFEDDDDCQLMLDAIADGAQKFGLEVHAYSLMPNHYHLLVRSQHGHLSRAMRHIAGGFTRQVNARHEGWDGSVFRGRFRNQHVADDTYLKYLLAYIHLNPVRAHLVSRPDEPSWTSHRAYLGLDGAAECLTTAFLLDELGGASGVEDMVRRVHTGGERWPAALNTATGWLVDGDATRLPTRVEPPESVRLSPEEAERLVRKITKTTRAGLREASRGPRANPARRFAVWALRDGTALTQTEIGKRLDMTPNQVGKVLQRLGAEPPAPIAGWQAAWKGVVKQHPPAGVTK